MLRRVSIAIAIVLTALVAAIAVVLLVSLAVGERALVAFAPAFAGIAAALVVPAYPREQRTVLRFVGWAVAGVLVSLIPIAYLAVRVAWRRTGEASADKLQLDA